MIFRGDQIIINKVETVRILSKCLRETLMELVGIVNRKGRITIEPNDGAEMVLMGSELSRMSTIVIVPAFANIPTQSSVALQIMIFMVVFWFKHVMSLKRIIRIILLIWYLLLYQECLLH